eukprot:scaffold37523_cov29-Phaeocystis_antarctica.AAC.1
MNLAAAEALCYARPSSSGGEAEASPKGDTETKAPPQKAPPLTQENACGRARCGPRGAPWTMTCPTKGVAGTEPTVPTKVPLDSAYQTTTYSTRLRSAAAPAPMPSAQEAARADGVGAESEGRRRGRRWQRRLVSLQRSCGSDDAHLERNRWLNQPTGMAKPPTNTGAH